VRILSLDLVYQMTVRKAWSRLMMVDDHHLQARLPGESHLVRVIHPAIHRDKNTCPARGYGLYGRAREPISLFEAAGQIPVDVCSELAKSQQQQSSGGDAVGVIVSVHHDLSPCVQSGKEGAHDGAHVGEEEGVW
jgi:hypothetical protein